MEMLARTKVNVLHWQVEENIANTGDVRLIGLHMTGSKPAIKQCVLEAGVQESSGSPTKCKCCTFTGRWQRWLVFRLGQPSRTASQRLYQHEGAFLRHDWILAGNLAQYTQLLPLTLGEPSLILVPVTNQSALVIVRSALSASIT